MYGGNLRYEFVGGGGGGAHIWRDLCMEARIL